MSKHVRIGGTVAVVVLVALTVTAVAFAQEPAPDDSHPGRFGTGLHECLGDGEGGLGAFGLSVEVRGDRGP